MSGEKRPSWLLELSKRTLREAKSASPVSVELFVPPTLLTLTGDPFPYEKLAQQKERALIVAPMGAGKTTLLRYIAQKQAESFLAGSGIFCPLFISARSANWKGLSRDRSLQVAANAVRRGRNAEVTDQQLQEVFCQGFVSLLFDGIDELPMAADQAEAMLWLEWIATAYPGVAIVAASRPFAIHGGRTSLQTLRLEILDSAQVRSMGRAIAVKLTGSHEIAERFLAALASAPLLRDLANSPLLLTFLCELYVARNSFPTTIADAYADFAELSLSKADKAKSPERPRVPLRVLHASLEQIARDLYEHGTHVLTIARCHQLILQAISFHLLPQLDTHPVLFDLLQSRLLVEHGPDSLGFTHISFLEFYVARGLEDREEAIVDLLHRPGSRRIILLAAGLIGDVGGLVEAAIAYGDPFLAAQIISNSRTDNRRLAEYVVRVLAGELDSRLVQMLARVGSEQKQSASIPTMSMANPTEIPTAPVSSTANATPTTALEPLAPDPYILLLSAWDRFLLPDLAAHEKGRRFEEFMEQFLGQVFKVIQKDLNTVVGELDIIIENQSREPFWAEYGGDILVECKNWKETAPLHEIGAFSNKVIYTRGIKLAFFVSVSGFTPNAVDSLRFMVANQNMPFQVPITGQQLHEALLTRMKFEDFFKGVIRAHKYPRAR